MYTKTYIIFFKRLITHQSSTSYQLARITFSIAIAIVKYRVKCQETGSGMARAELEKLELNPAVAIKNKPVIV